MHDEQRCLCLAHQRRTHAGTHARTHAARTHDPCARGDSAVAEGGWERPRARVQLKGELGRPAARWRHAARRGAQQLREQPVRGRRHGELVALLLAALGRRGFGATAGLDRCAILDLGQRFATLGSRHLRRVGPRD